RLDRLWKILGERLQRTVGPGGEADVGEEAGHHDAFAELAEARLGPVAVRDREDELRVAAAGREREREAATEARIDVRDAVRAVGLSEALDVRDALQRDRLRDVAADLDQLGVLDRHALDRLAPLRLDHRARDRVQAPALEVAHDVDREL